MVIKLGSTGEDVKTAQTILKQLGYYAGTVDGDFGPKTEAAVKKFQSDRKLDVDGVIGAKTWNALLYHESPKPSEPTIDALAHAGELAALEAERLWHLDIIDPPIGSKDPRAADSLKVINDIINLNGWGTNVSYKGNGQPQWCGMTAGWCWAKAGLDKSWLPEYFASTYRLGLWGRYERFSTKGKANPRPTDLSDRRLITKIHQDMVISALQPRRGDILIVGDGSPVDGDHVTVVVGWDVNARSFDTISGNGGGAGPHGNSREGISRRYYRMGASGYRPLWLIRPALGDLLAEHPLG